MSKQQLLVLFAVVAMATIVQAAVVINEVDYDQPGTDATEFVELYNNGASSEDLGGMVLELINGSNNTMYQTLTLPSFSLAADGYFVICANPAGTPNCDYDWTPETNLIQNGAPDAVILIDALGAIIDAVSYEGSAVAPYVEGTGFGGADSGSLPYLGISRYPNGVDTDDNSVDFFVKCITPGSSNSVVEADCMDPVPAEKMTWSHLKAMYGR